eukprot:c6194_g1_i3.p1 GENE.c6194_g1_i3~~c6194_g1_i3.p1  ORF type:complete len:183 (+),score=44.31 c6194_g1_i3:50-598(+)
MDVEDLLKKRKRENEEQDVGQFAHGNEVVFAKPNPKVQVTRQSNVDDIVDQLGAAKPMDANDVKIMMITLDKRIAKNQELRVKFADDPQKFMESELELHEHLEEMTALAASPELFPNFVRLGAVPQLLQLLISHENVDVLVDVVNLFNELLDAETYIENPESVDVLVTALVRDCFTSFLTHR